MHLKIRKGSAVVDVVIGAAIIIFVVLPLFSIVAEKYILLNKVQIIKDAVDMTNISVYNALDAESLGKDIIDFDYLEAEHIYRVLLAANLNLDDGLSPLPQSLAESTVSIEALIIYTGNMNICPYGVHTTRPSVHSCVSIPVKPSLYRQLILNALHKEFVDIKIHVDTEIPLNN
jgi:hypothetical protein